MSETVYVNVVATAVPAPITVYYWDGTSRDVFIKDGELNLGPEHLIKQVVVRTVEASPDCVLSVGTIGEATERAVPNVYKRIQTKRLCFRLRTRPANSSE